MENHITPIAHFALASGSFVRGAGKQKDTITLQKYP
jgi:hypothetical protein